MNEKERAISLNLNVRALDIFTMLYECDDCNGTSANVEQLRQTLRTLLCEYSRLQRKVIDYEGKNNE